MKKGFKYYIILWVILLAVFNIICFVTPNELAEFSKIDASFWTGYVFITIAFVGQLICTLFALNTGDKTRLFYNIPIIRVSYIGLILTIIAGVLCMVIPNLPSWIGIVVCLVILAFTAIAVFTSKVAADVVEHIDNEVKAKTLFVKSLTTDAESLLARAESTEAKAACKKVYEAARYSDPMSNVALAGVESQITLKFNEFAQSIMAGNENAGKLADELVILIGDRNKKCKELK